MVFAVMFLVYDFLQSCRGDIFLNDRIHLFLYELSKSEYESLYVIHSVYDDSFIKKFKTYSIACKRALLIN